MRKREPLLSDDAIIRRIHALGPMASVFEKTSDIRDHYERLIDEGKLRVVEEVEWVPGIGHCSGCGWDGAWPDNFCPGCGNKIKR